MLFQKFTRVLADELKERCFDKSVFAEPATLSDLSEDMKTGLKDEFISRTFF